MERRQAMALYDWMKGEYAARERTAPTADARQERRSRLETMLACAGIAVWLLSAYEMLLTALK
jgi:hypothetical protein